MIIGFLCFAITVPGMLLKMALCGTGESHCPGTGETVLDEISRECNEETLLCETSRGWRCRGREELSPSYALFIAEMGT